MNAEGKRYIPLDSGFHCPQCGGPNLAYVNDCDRKGATDLARCLDCRLVSFTEAARTCSPRTAYQRQEGL
jgi:transcription elongation factor Elf1